MKNILVVNVNWIGDVVFSSPVFKALKERYPQARIVCLAVPRVREILESIPAIDEIISYEERGRHWTPWGKAGLVLALGRYNFDAAFLLHGSVTRALLVRLAGIPIRVGYERKKHHRWLTHSIALPPPNSHRADHYLNIVKGFGVSVPSAPSYLTIDVEADRNVDKILLEQGIGRGNRMIAIHQGGNWNLKRWPRENFIVLLKHLARRRGVRVVLTGTQQDAEAVDSIIEGYARGDSGAWRPVSLAGKLSLKELMALFKKSDLMISADSGPLHLADSLDTPLIGLFGPTKEKITGPRGTGPRVILGHDVGCNRTSCYFQGCPDNVCMQAITVQEVLDAIERLLPAETKDAHE